LGALNARAQSKPRVAAVASHSVNGFSDLNQRMLKVLLAPRIPATWLTAPRGEYRNVSELARAAQVSAPRLESVFRGAVLADGVPAADVIQVWLDVQHHPARGRQQADENRQRVLRPLFSEGER
jgi:hypothetical protein